MKNTKRALLLSALAVVMSVAMLIGSTFAWFTDSASTAVNSIVSGTLDIAIEKADGTNLEGSSLNFVAADGTTNVLWEPNCTFNTEEFYIVNNGNLALKFQFDITGAIGDVQLLNVIDLTAIVNTNELFVVNGDANIAVAGNVDLLNGAVLNDGTKIKEYILAPGQELGPIAISGHMDKDAGNEYQGLTVQGLAISLIATQAMTESDSIDESYDMDAEYLSLPKAEVVVNGASDITDNSLDANDLAFNNSYVLPTPLVLDASYDFIAPSTVEPNYANWRADYVVSVDADIEANTLILAGAYDEILDGTWIAFSNPIEVKAGQKIPLLASFFGEGNEYTYEVICEYVREFKCGVANISVPAGVTLTVELKLFETDAEGNNTGIEHTIAVVNHVF